jgi:hypothetical protein
MLELAIDVRLSGRAAMHVQRARIRSRRSAQELCDLLERSQVLDAV